MSFDNFKATLYGMFQKQLFCDVQFTCNDPTSETGKSPIMAHKFVLSLTSDVFFTMFYGEAAKLAAKNESVTDEIARLSPIHIEDVKMSTFMLFLSFAYNKLVHFETPEVAIEFYYVAHKYNSLDALKFITDYMMQVMSSENVFTFYYVACVYENPQLKGACFKWFSEKTVDVINSQGFLNADPQMIETIFKLNALHITSEAELIRALERYIAHNQEDDCDIVEKVRPALSHIRFLTLSAPQISETSLLDATAALAVIGCLSPNSPLSKMPIFLSSNNQSRSTMKVVSQIQLEKMRKLSEVYSSLFCPHCKKGHPVWECKIKNVQTNSTKLKSIYQKYKHTWLQDYDTKDVSTVYSIYSKICKWQK